MKLPDFLHNGAMNALRSEMGAPLSQSFQAKGEYRLIELPIGEQLRDTGIEVRFDQLTRLPDGTLGYGQYRVLLYIRDVANYGGRDVLPKFHVYHCSVLERMQRERRFDRYVVATRDDGKFIVNLMGSAERGRMTSLDVCQQCLGGLNWKKFTSLLDREERLAAVRHFSLKEFFGKYPKDLVTITPRHTSDTAPLNDYPENWNEIKDRVRAQRGLKCEQCRRVLGEAGRRYLHLHHRNGLKHDNADSNLELLCIACHAEEPSHNHIKNMPDYLDFINKTWFRN
ncbi:MAG: HNH endonuclease [Comamonas sp.]|nr:HNH endonuclease [Comamonas sp.]